MINKTFVVACIASVISGQALAETRFYEPTNLSKNTGLSFAPSVAVGSTGQAYVAWYDNSAGGNEILMARSSDKGKTFASAMNVSNNTGLSTFPSVAVDINGIVHVAWQDTQYGKSEILYSRSTDGGASYSAPVNISNDNSTSTNAKLATDSNGRVFLAWVDSTQISVARSTNGGASFTKAYSYSPVGASPFNPVLAVGSDGTLHMAWSEDGGTTRAIRYASSTNQGSQFTSPVTVASGANISRPAMAIGGSSYVYIAYIDDSVAPAEINFVRSTNRGSSFATPVNLTNNTGTSLNPSLAVDSSGTVYLAWQDTISGNYDTFFARSTDNGASFSSPVNVSPSTEGSLFTAIAVDQSQNVYVAWDDNRYVNTTFETIVAVGRENLPATQNALVSPEVISPNGDGKDDTTTISATFTERTQWQLDILNSSNVVAFRARGQALSLSYVWDGKNLSGVKVPDGTYTYKITGTGSSGYEAIPATGTLMVNTVKDSTAPAISSFAVDASTFSPNGDGFKDSVALTAQFNKSVNWTITVENDAKSVVKTITGTGLSLSSSWDGKNSNGQVVADGNYKLKLKIVDSNGSEVSCDAAGTVTCLSAKVDTVAPELSTLYLSNSVVSPNGDGVNDSTSIAFNPTERALITIYVYEDRGTLVRELDRSYHLTGENSLSWDGLDGTGNMLPTGSYTIKIWCRDSSGNTAPTYPYEMKVELQ